MKNLKVNEYIYHEHHLHSHFSINDSVNRIPKIVKKCVENKCKSVTLTDHGTLGGVYELVKECKENKIKPIIGIEAYFVDDYETEEAKIPYNYAHLILLAKNEQGWKNLKEIQSIAWNKGFLKKPRIDMSILSKFKEGLIVSTACLRGIVGYDLLNFSKSSNDYSDGTVKDIKERKKAVKVRLNKFIDLFGEDLYLELQYNDIESQALLNRYLLKLSEKFGVKCIASGDCHYLKKDDYKIHDIMICNFRGKLLSDIDNGTYPTHQLFVRDTNSVKNAWQAWHDDYVSEEQFNLSIKHTEEISNKVEQFPIKPKMVCLPKFCDDPKEQFKQWVDNGWQTKLTKVQQQDKVYQDRLQHELEVFDKLGMETYMLVCADIIKKAVKAEIPTGPGRGSVAGSLVAYLMDITQIDPIRFNTSFERFLTADRLSLPDIDMDFGKEGREIVKESVKKQYGEDKFAAIVTYMDWKPRGLIKDIGRVLGRTFQEMNDLTKQIDDKTKKFEDEEVPLLPEVVQWLNDHPEISDPALRLEGVYRQRGVHASGMILTPSKLEDWVPVAFMTEKTSEDKKPVKVSEWDMYALEDLQILKMDFLGLRTLDVITMAVNLINKDEKKIKDIWQTCLNDIENKQVYDMLCSGRILGCFQLETSDGMAELIKNIKPNCFEDIIMIISLYRSAVIQAGMLDAYVSRRNGQEFEYIHESVESILKGTLGVLVFQEQVMEIGVVCGGLSRSESDNFRKAMKLKDVEKFKAWQNKFIEGCRKNNIDEDSAKKLWDWCQKFSSYGFNRAHSVAYALLTYATAWLKHFYPKEYMTSVMSFNTGDDIMMSKYIGECEKMELNVTRPDINYSQDKFIIRKERIVSPFNVIANVGEKAVEAILTARGNNTFESFEEFLAKIDKRVVNIRVLGNLILAGAFNTIEGRPEKCYDILVEDRKDNVYRQLYCEDCDARYPCNINKSESSVAYCPSCSSAEVDFELDNFRNKRFSKPYLANMVFGFSFAGNPLKRYVAQITKHDVDILSTLESLEEGDIISTAVFVKRIKKHIDKNQHEMAFVDVSDGEFDCSLTFFASDWKNIEKEIQQGCCYILRAAKNRGNNLLFSSRDKRCKIIRLGV